MAFSPQSQEGSADSIKRGILKRRLPAVVVARLSSAQAAGTGTLAARLQLKNLSGDLNVQIAGAFGSPDSQANGLLPAVVPAGAVTMQLTPTVLTPNAGRVYLRPVFQDPTANQNENHPLPQDLPFGWEFSTEGDEVYIDITANVTLIGTNMTNVDAQVLIAVTIEYNGEWWDIKAAQEAISRVILQGAGGNVPIIGTQLS